ncbi:MAG: hypothetical protein AB1696_27070 [Planctomycetota bacterium]
MPKNPYLGKWRIEEMEHWDKDFIDMLVPGHITIEKRGMGHFQFGAVEGQMDWRIDKCGSHEQLGFSWEGNDECDPASGRGWAVIKDGGLFGRLYFHLGDDSWFRASRIK